MASGPLTAVWRGCRRGSRAPPGRRGKQSGPGRAGQGGRAKDPTPREKHGGPSAPVRSAAPKGRCSSRTRMRRSACGQGREGDGWPKGAPRWRRETSGEQGGSSSASLQIRQASGREGAGGGVSGPSAHARGAQEEVAGGSRRQSAVPNLLQPRRGASVPAEAEEPPPSVAHHAQRPRRSHRSRRKSPDPAAPALRAPRPAASDRLDRRGSGACRPISKAAAPGASAGPAEGALAHLQWAYFPELSPRPGLSLP